jgi:hypothetical protein
MLRQLQRTADPESTTRLGSKWFFRSNPLSSYQLLPINHAAGWVRRRGISQPNSTARHHQPAQ